VNGDVVADATCSARKIRAHDDVRIEHTVTMSLVHWPLFGLRITTPHVVLRYPDDRDCSTLADIAAEGIHDPEFMPFSIPWTDVEPPMLQRQTMQYYWGTRARWTADRWELPMAVVLSGAVVGLQALESEQFKTRRDALTGSWLGASYQGKGIGTEMRQAILHLAFAGLGAEYAESGAFTDNSASLAVTRKLGYEESGRRLVVRRGEPAWLVDFRLSRERWERTRRDDIVISGLEPCLELFGAT
jgi:RimJ/RimL family protein N-acetyltransferase